MAEKRKKADVIREYIGRHPEMGSTALAQLIENENKGLTVKSAEVANYRRLAKQNQAEASATTTNATAAVAQAVAQLKRASDALGGKEAAKQILDMLG